MRAMVKRVDWAIAVAVLVVFLGGAAMIAKPDEAWRYAIAMVAPTLALAGLEAVRHTRLADCEPPAAWKAARGVLTGASALLAVGLALVLLDASGVLVDSERAFRRRLLGAGFGALMMVYGNELPRLLPRPGTDATTAARHQAKQRAAGWMMALGGVVSLLVWLGAPVGVADVVSTAVWPIVALCMAGYWVRRRPRAA